MINFILTLINCHLINDFIFQKKNSANKNNIFDINTYFLHNILGAFISFFICILFFKSTIRESYSFSLFIFISYLIIDFFNDQITKKIIKPYYSFIYFFLDQIIRLITIINISSFFYKDKFNSFNPLYIKYQLIILTFIFVSFYSAFIISNILNIIYYPFPDYNSKLEELTLLHIESKTEKEITNKFFSLPIGKTIGILERSILFISIMTLELKNASFIITGLITLKSITRFKFMDIKIFSEFYLIGTLLSFIFALLPFFISILIPDKIKFINMIISFFIYI